MQQLAGYTMAKRNDASVKIDTEIVRLAKIVAAYRDVSLAEYLSEVLLPIVQSDLVQEQSKTQAKQTPKGKPGKKE